MVAERNHYRKSLCFLTTSFSPFDVKEEKLSQTRLVRVFSFGEL
jgi:hypothetical protein